MRVGTTSTIFTWEFGSEKFNKMFFAATGIATQLAVMFIYAVTDTIGAALIAAVASIVNTWLIARLSTRSKKRLDEIEDHVKARRMVVTRNDTDGVVIIGPEERRELGEWEDETQRR